MAKIIRDALVEKGYSLYVPSVTNQILLIYPLQILKNRKELYGDTYAKNEK